MLSLIKSKTKKQDGSRTGSNNKIIGKRSKSLISKPIEVLTSANLSKLQQQNQQQQQQQANPNQEADQQLLVNSSGETVLLQSAGGVSFGFTAMEIPRPASVMQQQSQPAPPERPSSRSSNSSRSYRSNQPRLGVGGNNNNNTYLFEDDPGIMSEVETSSTARFRGSKPSRGDHRPPPAASSGAAARLLLPRTSPKSYSSGLYYDDDPGIMSEAETASTTRGKRSSNRNNSIPSMGNYGSKTDIHSSHSGKNQSQQQQRSVQFRYPVAQFHPSHHASHGSNSNLFDEDPGIMSEADTSSTSGRKRRQLKAEQAAAASLHQPDAAIGGSKKYGNSNAPGAAKDYLPIVRTPSKTLERPLGLVFLVYRGETKRAVLPNEITSLDTVKALFVRSFAKTLTMEYMDTPRVHIYIHDSSKDIFYELENLSEIRDRTILKLFEADSSGRGPSGLGPSGLPPITNADDEAAAVAMQQQQITVPPVSAGGPITEPEYVDSRHVKAMKVLSRVQREYEQAMASSNTLPRNAFSALEQEKLATMLQQATTANTLGERSKTLGPGFMRGHQGLNNSRVESGYVSSPDGSFEQQVNNVMVPSRFSAWPEGGRYYPRPESTEEAKARMMHMEAQLSQLTGMVEKALKNKKLGKKTVSFDKSVTYSDDPQPHPQGILITNKNKQLNGSNAPPTSSSTSASNSTVLQHRCGQNNGTVVVTTTNHTGAAGSVEHPGEMYVNLKRLHKSARELKQEVRVLRRLTQLQSMAMKDLVQDTYIKLREACISFSTNQNAPLMAANYDPELWRLVTDEETFVKELNDLVSSICQLEAKVEETRSGVINKKNKISLVDVESMAYTLSKCSKTVTLLKQAFPTLEANIKSKNTASEYPEKRRMTEDFLKRTPDRMENIWRRCKKLTGTLVTLKRLASVQEQRFHPGSVSIEMSLSPTPTAETIVTSMSSNSKNGNASDLAQASPKTKKSSSRPASTEITDLTTNGSSSSSTSESNKKAAPPPPPPRSSSTKSNNVSDEPKASNEVGEAKVPPPVAAKPVNVDIKSLTAKARQDALEQRHQELLSRQKQLQEQYERLQNMQQKNTTSNGGGNGGGSSTSSLSSTSSSLSTTAEMKPVNQNSTSTAENSNNEVSKAKPTPPAVPMRTNSSLTNNDNNQQNDNQKVYQTDII